MAPTPEDRQLAIDVLVEHLVSNGMDDTDATEFATSAVDQAIQRKMY